jgi:hypothetical protein
VIRRMDGRIASMQELRDAGTLPPKLHPCTGCGENKVTRQGAFCLPCALDDAA